MSSDGVPRVGDRSDVIAGLFHLLAELGALAGLLTISGLIAWVMLLF